MEIGLEQLGRGGIAVLAQLAPARQRGWDLAQLGRGQRVFGEQGLGDVEAVDALEDAAATGEVESLQGGDEGEPVVREIGAVTGLCERQHAAMQGVEIKHTVALPEAGGLPEQRGGVGDGDEGAGLDLQPPGLVQALVIVPGGDAQRWLTRAKFKADLCGVGQAR